MRTDMPKVVFWMIGSLTSFSVSAVALRSLAGKFNLFEIIGMRNALGIAILLGAALVHPPFRRAMRPKRWGLHLVRSAIHFGGQYTWALAVTLLPLATVFALEFTAPFWVAVFAVPILGEKLTGPRLASLMLGFAGILVIMRPGLETLQPTALLVLGAAVLFALTSVLTKVLLRTETVFTIMLWMNIFQFAMNLPGMRTDLLSMIAPGDLPAILGISLGGLLAHVCLANAFKSGDAIVVIPIDFLRIPLIAVVGWLIYDEIIDPVVMLGAALMLSGLIYAMRAEAKAAKTAESPA